MQRDRKIVAASWLAAGQRDLCVGHATLSIEPSLSAFHAQQAAEKALTAMLVLVADDHPGTHVATTLVRELIVLDPSARELESDASALDLYYLTSRYPDAVGDIDPGDVIGVADAERALKRSERVVAYARQKLDSRYSRERLATPKKAQKIVWNSTTACFVHPAYEDASDCGRPIRTIARLPARGLGNSRRARPLNAQKRRTRQAFEHGPDPASA